MEGSHTRSSSELVRFKQRLKKNLKEVRNMWEVSMEGRGLSSIMVSDR
jgi:hypothetical protein